jgi:hypothetical protein
VNFQRPHAKRTAASLEEAKYDLVLFLGKSTVIQRGRKSSIANIVALPTPATRSRLTAPTSLTANERKISTIPWRNSRI